MSVRPWMVLLVAVVLPGCGQVLLGLPRRGLMFAFYAVLMGVITWHLAPPTASFVGHLAGGLFVYAISVLDAYLWAQRRATASALDVSRQAT
ncbi:hypothetical protein Acsp06_52520 [Actinomycetospora sp. NBRC 106375]|uniref:hypothetical protein n=1 Tax=Actinomycetospora sp. NBRC 106375 TaxID=3032207 RepID=UPI0024A12D00|nr:hypothetical protein [Actinomycetospora sp. NBRC 106375]GLZ49067.1 hypothetical protein Acsp06_52520 [Actinomycetospora sp. NBRC 106375]